MSGSEENIYWTHKNKQAYAIGADKIFIGISIALVVFLQGYMMKGINKGKLTKMNSTELQAYQTNLRSFVIWSSVSNFLIYGWVVLNMAIRYKIKRREDEHDFVLGLRLFLSIAALSVSAAAWKLASKIF